MRIIAGEYRSRKLLSPPEGTPTRPIPDRVKESLFNLLRGNVEGAAVLDAFAGSGAIGLEALSRGASQCVFIERDRRVADVLKRNIETLGCEDRAEVVVGDALGMAALARCPRPVDLIFFDPPYELVMQSQPGAGWDRVKGQFGRMVERLADTGFAMLRTPWPFVHTEEQEEPATEGRSARTGRDRERDRDRDRGRRGRRWDEDVEERGGPRPRQGGDRFVDEEGEEWVELEPEELEAQAEGAEEPEDAEAASAEPKPKPQRWDVDLKVPGAVGPETHVYRHTALHLYMRKRE